MGSGTPQIILLGGGNAADGAHSQSASYTSGSSAGQVSVALDTASDTGVKGDNRTNFPTPTFDVTVNQAGTIAVDYKGDGTATASQTVSAGGTYPFTAPTLPDGTYNATATFTPSGGTAISAKVSYVIDTVAPTLRRGPAPPKGRYTRAR